MSSATVWTQIRLTNLFDTLILLEEFFENLKLILKLEDLKVLRRSPDLLNNVKIGQGQLQLIMKQILFYHILGLGNSHFGQVT